MAPVTFDNPGRYAGSTKWQIKIYDGESPREDPHVSVIYKERPLKTWRINLMTLEAMDAAPPMRELPREFMNYIRTNVNMIRAAWNQKYPKQRIELDEPKSQGQEGESGDKPV